MIDDKPSQDFPERRSSIAAFYDEPAENPPQYCDRKITSLKIVWTITSYQLAQAERSTDYG